MKSDTFLNAVGMADDRYLDIAVSPKRAVHRKWRRVIISASAAAALVICPLPALTAMGVDTAYNALYFLAPSAAQTFKPVRKSCTDNGIEMTVISAEHSGSKVSVCLAMRDIAGSFPEGEWDLFDSYTIRVPHDMTGHCSFSEYDADTHTAYFIVHLETMDGSAMSGGKVTFSVSELLIGKNKTEEAIQEVNMNSIPYEPKTDPAIAQKVCGASYYALEPHPEDYRFLTRSEQPLYTPMPGISIVGLGYVDGALHILTEYEDILHTDNHGYIQLLDDTGNAVAEEQSITFHYWDETRKNNCTEQIIPVSYDVLPDCSLYGTFSSAEKYVSGNWEVTFPLN